MPDKSASISQQRLMGMAWAARTGRLDTSKLDPGFKEKIDKIANSKNFSDDTLHKMAKTKHRDKDSKKLMPYMNGKGTPEDPERKRKPYKKKAVAENYKLKSIGEFILEKEISEFRAGYLYALEIMESEEAPLFEWQTAYAYIVLKEDISLNPGMNIMGMGPVSSPGAPGTSTDFHSQEVGSGDIPWPFEKEDDEEEEEKKRIKKELESKKK